MLLEINERSVLIVAYGDYKLSIWCKKKAVQDVVY